jgi:hypothetical protein
MRAFVASAIGHLSPEEFQLDTAFIRKLMDSLEGIFGKEQVFCALEQFPEPKDYPPPSKALDICINGIVRCKFFFLYLPRKTYSGALVALIFTEKKEVLPYMMQDESELTGIVQLEGRSFDECVSRIQKFVAKWHGP